MTAFPIIATGSGVCACLLTCQTAEGSVLGDHSYRPLIASCSEIRMVPRLEMREGNMPAARDNRRGFEEAWGDGCSGASGTGCVASRTPCAGPSGPQPVRCVRAGTCAAPSTSSLCRRDHRPSNRTGSWNRSMRRQPASAAVARRCNVRTSFASFTTCILRWQFGQSATVFSGRSAPPRASQAIWWDSR